MPLNPNFQQGAMEQFQTGRQLAGTQHPLALLVQSVLSRVNALQQAHMEQQLKLRYDPEARFRQRLFTQLEHQTGPGGVDSNQFLRHYLGLPESSQEIQAKAAAQETGKQSVVGPEDVLKQQHLQAQIDTERQHQRKVAGGWFGTGIGGVKVPERSNTGITVTEIRRVP